MEIKALEKQAVEAALKSNWEKAIKLNQKILEKEPKNIAAFNRLARAYWESGEVALARKTYKKTLSLDRYNPIALKNLKRLINQKKKPARTKKPPLAELFLTEPGKTKVVKLIRLASSEILAELNNTDPVLLIPKKRFVVVQREDNTYLGSLPEDLSQRLISLIKGGNRYEAFVKAVDRQSLEIFIRETFRSRRFRNSPSFIQSRPIVFT